MRTSKTMQSAITAIARKHGLDLAAESAHLRLEMPNYDRLVIEKIGKFLVVVGHYYEQQGDVIADPEVVLFTGYGDWIPIEITQVVGGWKRYVELSPDGSSIERVDTRGQADLAEFVTVFARNIREQGWVQNAVKAESAREKASTNATTQAPVATETVVSSQQQLRPISYRGLNGFCTGLAGDELGTVYVSLIGRQTAVTGIWAAFHDFERLEMDDDWELAKRRVPEVAHYHTIKARLPDSGWVHLVLLFSQATVNNLPDETFYLLSEELAPPLDRFYHQLNNAIPLPIRPQWKRTLWEEGISAGLITPINAFGITGWRVSADLEDWQTVIEVIVKGRR